MHRVILDTPENLQTDHINGNKLDNQKHNLRACTGSQNKANNPNSYGDTSKFRGVSWVSSRKRWYSQTQFKNKNIFIGYFKKEIDAAKAYDNKVKELFGEFSQPNFIQKDKGTT